MRASNILGLLMATLFFADNANAQESSARDQARAHYERGAAQVQTGDYRGAIAEFETANQLAPSAVLSFNIAICYDALGEREKAVSKYTEYLEAIPEASNRVVVETRIATLRREIDEVAAVSAAPTANPETTPSTPTETTPSDSAAPSSPAQTELLPQAAPAPVLGPTTAPPPPISYGPPYPDASAPMEPETAPVYKKWWFWVVMGVSAVVLVDLMIDDGDNQRATVWGASGQNLHGTALFQF